MSVFRRINWWIFNKKWCRSCHKMTKHKFSSFYEAEECNICFISPIHFELVNITEQLQNGKDIDEIIVKYKFSGEFLKFTDRNFSVVGKNFINKKTFTSLDYEELHEAFGKHKIRKIKQQVNLNSNNFNRSKLETIIVIIMSLSFLALITLLIIGILKK